MIRENKVKKMLADGKCCVGTFIKSSDPAVTEVVCMSGFDFIVIDNEHTAMSKESMVNVIRAAELFEVTPIVRVRDFDQPQILQALDAGAMGVQVPNINTQEQAQHVVKSAKYKPEGYRGFAYSQRCAGYGIMNGAEYAQMSNANVMSICYCETLDAYNNLDEILKVNGIDVIFIGPNDLSQAFGVTADIKHEKVTTAIDIIIEKTLKAGKDVGIIAANGDEVNYWSEKGVKFIVMSADLSLISNSAKTYFNQIKGR